MVVVLFSAVVNLLLLTSPLYMLQVYDRVLTSRSEATLVVLTALAAFLFLILGVLDHARTRILARIGARLRQGLDKRVHAAALARSIGAPGDARSQTAQRDLDALARLWSSPALAALIDAPWALLFLWALFVFHPVLGMLAVAGGLVLAGAAFATRLTTGAPLRDAALAQAEAEREAMWQRAEAEVLKTLGMTGAAQARMQHWRDRGLMAGLAAADRAGAWSSLARSFRLFLQSAMLGAAAWLVLQDQLSPGAMVAASVLMGRALLPLEQAIACWSALPEAQQARRRLADLLDAAPVPHPSLALPRPRGFLEVQGLAVAPPGQGRLVLRGVSFALQPGQALGVIGPSAAGKSALARALAGAWPPAAGHIRLDGAELSHYPSESLGATIGYLPQQMRLFDGSVAENIARLDPLARPEDVLRAAQAAAAHDMILRLPEGYDCRLAADAPGLSGGQMQRIGLARALYGDPTLLILDEPNANLDSDGTQALNQAVRRAKAAGAVVVLMAHRPVALQDCDLLMVLRQGQVADFGPRDRVLRDQVRNAEDITQAIIRGATG